MTMTDTILFVKEAKTCSYVLVIHTPRLCSEPGFKSPLDSREEVTIRCREIVDSDADLQLDQPHLTESDQPYHLPRRKPPLPIGALIQKDSAESEQTTGDAINVMIKRAVGAYLGNKGIKLPEGEYPPVITDQFGEDGIFLIDIPIDELDETALANALRAAGIEIQMDKTAKSNEEEDSDETSHVHDEL
jgi:protein OS-9